MKVQVSAALLTVGMNIERERRKKERCFFMVEFCLIVSYGGGEDRVCGVGCPQVSKVERDGLGIYYATDSRIQWASLYYLLPD